MKSSHFSQRHSHATLAQLVKLFLVLLFVAVALVSFPIYAYGAQTIHLCVKTNGYLRLPTKAIPCAQDEYAVSWTMVQPEELEALQNKITQLESLLAGVSRQGDNLVFSGMNVQIVNGTGKTYTANSLGNLTIGYNENWSNWERTGSHYLVVGVQHGYTKWGGIVAGVNNQAGGEYASVLGGATNVANGDWSVVAGGIQNTVLGTYKGNKVGVTASITGGVNNWATGRSATVTGGNGDWAAGEASSVAGGYMNYAGGEDSSVSGGLRNNAKGIYSSILGGRDNVADDKTSVWGGYSREVIPKPTASPG